METQNGQNQQPMPMPQPQYQPRYQQQYQQQRYQQQQYQQPQYQRPQKQAKSAEFVIGAALSIVGGIFVLIALLLFGMYLMNSFLKGMLLYVVCLAVMLVSELILYRRWRGLGLTLSAIAVGGLYITTLVNFMAMGNFNAWVCLTITAVITAAVIILSRKRDAAAYRIIGIAACYLSLLIIPATQLGTAWLFALTGALFLINVMCVFVPVKTHAEAIAVTHLSIHSAVSFIIFFRWADFGHYSYTADSIWPVLIWCGAALLTEQMIYGVQICRKSADGREHSHLGMTIAYGISMVFYTAIAVLLGAEGWADAGMSGLLREREICTIAAFLICGAAILMLRGRPQRWFPVYLFYLLILALHIEAVSVSPYSYAATLTVVWIVTSLLNFTKDIHALIGSAVVTGYACFYMLCNLGETRSLLLLAGLFVCILCINRFQTYFSAVLTFTGALYASYYMLPSLKLPVFVGILFLGMLVFNHVERWKDKDIFVYNILALTGQGICFLLLLNPVYRNAYLTYFCMLIFGLSTIVVCFQPQYHLGSRGRELIISIFLSYMALILKTDYDVINSILLMVIALISVTIGFISHKKSVRIYGLILSLLVCAKLVLFDFLGTDILEKTILFLAVGLIAIIISAIYMILEKQTKEHTPHEG